MNRALSHEGKALFFGKNSYNHFPRFSSSSETPIILPVTHCIQHISAAAHINWVELRRNHMKHFFTYIWKDHRKPAIILGILGILSSVTSIVMSYSLKYSVDYIFHVTGSNRATAFMLFGIMAAATYLSDQVGETYFVEKYSLSFVRGLRKRLIASHLEMPYAQARERRAGEWMNQDNVANEVGSLFVTVAYHFPYCILESAGFLLFLGIAVSWKMDLILILLIPFALFMKKIIEKMRKTKWDINCARTESHNLFLDILQKTDFVKANGISERIRDKYRQKNRTVFSLQKLILRQNGILAFTHFFLEHGIQFLVAVIGAALLRNGELTPGGVAVATTVFSTFLVPSLSQLIGLIQETGSSQKIVSEIMQRADAGKELQIYNHETMENNTLLRLEQASYHGRNGAIFEEISLELPPTGFLGIYGMSGEGKSTLARMIAGLLQPADGKIVYNSLYFDADVCGKIAYLNSDPFFMDGTILENLQSGGEDWKRVMEMQEFKAFLDGLPHRENTILTADGATLSGGQRQLLGLARALAKREARLLILDEPTASMDEDSRREVWQLLKRLSQEKCVLAISHQREMFTEIPVRYHMKNRHLQKET